MLCHCALLCEFGLIVVAIIVLVFYFQELLLSFHLAEYEDEAELFHGIADVVDSFASGSAAATDDVLVFVVVFIMLLLVELA